MDGLILLCGGVLGECVVQREGEGGRVCAVVALVEPARLDGGVLHIPIDGCDGLAALFAGNCGYDFNGHCVKSPVASD
ncbi:MAG: hypothetical protein RIC84_08860 [Aggregatilineales bacterium]